MSILWNCLAVGGGGAIGSVFRYLLGMLPLNQKGFPFTTLGINVIGAFLIGIVIALAAKHSNADPRLILFLQVGFCGGFTTFSTFSNETLTLMQNGRFSIALLYIVASVVLCVCAVFVAKMIFR